MILVCIKPSDIIIVPIVDRYCKGLYFGPTVLYSGHVMVLSYCMDVVETETLTLTRCYLFARIYILAFSKRCFIYFSIILSMDKAKNFVI